MRKKIHEQLPLMPALIDHEHVEEVLAMGEVLDQLPSELLALVQSEIETGDPGRGRPGMTADQVIRCMIIKQMRGFSYDRLAFHLADSVTYRTFCRFGIADNVPKKSTLQENIKRVSAETVEALNCWLVGYARTSGIEKGRTIRIDSTVTETNIHHPTDNSLLFDVVRVLCGLMAALGCAFTNHTRRAKRRDFGIRNAKNQAQRLPLYRDLLKVTRKTLRAAARGAWTLQDSGRVGGADQITNYVELGWRVVDQAERRLLKGEKVPAREKVVSIFEPHTDVIVKDRRDVHYGHKLNMTSGASGLVLDVVVEEGNPADSTRAVVMIERQSALYGRVPRQVVYDGGYASKPNLEDIKKLGVKDVAFSKKRGFKVCEMVKSSWVYRKLKRFRAGAEAVISLLKRCFGLDRCTWRGLRSFKAYVWSGVLSSNLLLVARHRIAEERAG